MLSHLPIELLAKIFYCVKNKQIMKLSLVCKQFYELISDDLFWINKTKNINVYDTLKTTLSLGHRIKNKKLIHEMKNKIDDVYSLQFINEYIRIQIYFDCFSLIYDNKLNFLGYVHDMGSNCNRNCNFDHNHYRKNIKIHKDMEICNKFIKVKSIIENNDILLKKCRDSIFEIIPKTEDDEYSHIIKIKNNVTNEISKLAYIDHGIIIFKGTLIDIKHNGIIDLYKLLPALELGVHDTGITYFDINKINIITCENGIIKFYNY